MAGVRAAAGPVLLSVTLGLSHSAPLTHTHAHAHAQRAPRSYDLTSQELTITPATSSVSVTPGKDVVTVRVNLVLLPFVGVNSFTMISNAATLLANLVGILGMLGGFASAFAIVEKNRHFVRLSKFLRRRCKLRPVDDPKERGKYTEKIVIENDDLDGPDVIENVGEFYAAQQGKAAGTTAKVAPAPAPAAAAAEAAALEAALQAALAGVEKEGSAGAADSAASSAPCPPPGAVAVAVAGPSPLGAAAPPALEGGGAPRE